MPSPSKNSPRRTIIEDYYSTPEQGFNVTVDMDTIEELIHLKAHVIEEEEH